MYILLLKLIVKVHFVGLIYSEPNRCQQLAVLRNANDNDVKTIAVFVQCLPHYSLTAIRTEF
jgi:hypothetical protein